MEDLNDIKYSDATDLDTISFGVSDSILAHNTIIKDITLSIESMEEFLKHVYFAEKRVKNIKVEICSTNKVQESC